MLQSILWLIPQLVHSDFRLQWQWATGNSFVSGNKMNTRLLRYGSLPVNGQFISAEGGYTNVSYAHIVNEEGAAKWLDEFSCLSTATWRVKKSYTQKNLPDCTVYKVGIN